MFLKAFKCINQNGLVIHINKLLLCKDDNSKYVSCPSGRLHYFKETYLRVKMCEYVKHKFESHEWNIPKGYKYYLRKRYGDNYMIIPPRDKQEKRIDS